MPPAAAKDARMAVKLDPVTHDALQKLADRNNRTITGQIRQLVGIRPDLPTYVFRFDDWQVTAFQSTYRFFVSIPLCLQPDDGKKFRDALQQLEDDTGWKHWGRNDSLLNAVHCDCEYAHIFVAMNLPRLQAYANTGTAMWLSPGFCIQYAMIHGANGSDYLDGNETWKE